MNFIRAMVFNYLDYMFIYYYTRPSTGAKDTTSIRARVFNYVDYMFIYLYPMEGGRQQDTYSTLIFINFLKLLYFFLFIQKIRDLVLIWLMLLIIVFNKLL